MKRGGIPRTKKRWRFATGRRKILQRNTNVFPYITSVRYVDPPPCHIYLDNDVFFKLPISGLQIIYNQHREMIHMMIVWSGIGISINNPTHSWLFINEKGSLRVWISDQLQEYFQLHIFILWISIFADYQLIFRDSD